MNLDFLKLKKNFSDNGFFICKDVFKKEFIFKLIDEINSSKDTVKYFDNSNNLRRVEKLYDKGDFLKTLKLKKGRRPVIVGRLEDSETSSKKVFKRVNI